MDDLGEFLGLDRAQVFAAGLEGLEGLDDGLGHPAVGFVGTAKQHELVPRRDSLVAVLVVETEPKNAVDRRPPAPLRFAGIFAHTVTVERFSAVADVF